MKIIVSTVIGETKYNFHIDEQKDIEALHKAAVLGSPRKYCPHCKNNKYFQLISNKDKEGNTYVNIRCKNCGAKSKLGQYKVGGYFWREFEQYKPNETNTQAQQVAETFEGDVI